jgi:hypothetical protein
MRQQARLARTKEDVVFASNTVIVMPDELNDFERLS